MKFFSKRKTPAGSRANLSAPLSIKDKLTEVLSGLGGKSDRVSKIRYTEPDQPGRYSVSAAFEFDGIMERYITRPVEDGLAKGLEFPALSQDETNAIHDYLESTQLDFWGHMERAWLTMRMNNGAAIWLDTGTATPLSTPIRESERVRRLVVLDSEALHAGHYNRYTEPDYWECGDPEIPGYRIHKSRLLIFPGRFISYEYRQDHNGWGAREVDRIWEAWIHFKTTFLMPANIAMTYEEGVLSLEGLNKMMTTEQGRKTVKDKVWDLEAIRSFLRMRIQDVNDKFERKGAPVSGLDRVMDQARRYFVACTGWPHTILLGESPGAGLDGAGAGKSQKEDWQRIITAQQETYLRRPIRQFLETVRPDLRQRYNLPFDNLKFNFPAILQESEMERAQRQKIEAERDQIYMSNQAVDASEIRDDLARREVYALDPMDMPDRDQADPL